MRASWSPIAAWNGARMRYEVKDECMAGMREWVGDKWCVLVASTPLSTLMVPHSGMAVPFIFLRLAMMSLPRCLGQSWME